MQKLLAFPLDIYSLADKSPVPGNRAAANRHRLALIIPAFRRRQID
jgi:hypothetical protein